MILAVVLLTLAVAVIVIAVLARRKPAAERREAAGEAEADTFIGELRDTPLSPWFDDPGERMADTDTRTRYEVLPRTPMPPPVRIGPPRAIPDVPGTCHCGRPEGHIEALREASLDDIGSAFDTATFPAVQP